ncbi:PEP/pyruvate-binding domain-containing protein [Streptomyces shaanxiensis]|uniref:Pyruvate phosphate dikinase n=1 Tax=Streptomyces shaanxiensis TaxID=653357 RepID=A0ABP7ULP7_9ACTN
MTTIDECHGEGARDREVHRGDIAPGQAVEEYGPAIVPLDRPGAALPQLTGSKAANLARAARAGLPVLPGFVIPHRAGGDMVALRRAWEELSDGGAHPLVVRSSSPQEDTEESSLAGQFASVLDVRGWQAFRTAVQTVLDSAHRANGSTAQMAVLVQPMLTARVGGVMFGADPVEGRADRLLVSAVRGGPDSLVSGAHAGTDYWLSGHGRLLRTETSGDLGIPGNPEGPGDPRSPGNRGNRRSEAAEGRRRTEAPGDHRAAPSDEPWPASSTESSEGPRRRPSRDPQAVSSTNPHAVPSKAPSENPHPASAESSTLLTRAELFRLARLARQVRRVFGGPQDVEFGFDADGRLWLFQSRPITAMAARPGRGARLLGPGPVAETLPEQLAPLEEDLWVVPMARGLAAALDIGGTAPRRLLKSVPVVTTVAGRAAADLRLLGAVPPRHRWLALLNPAPGARRLVAAWRVGRLVSSLPGLATDLVADVDRRLAEIPSPSGLSGSALAAELRWTRRALVSLHAQEALAGALLDEPPKSRTAAGTALATLAEARAQGIPDDQLIATDPVILALTTPSLRGRGRPPGATAAASTTPATAPDPTRPTAIGRAVEEPGQQEPRPQATQAAAATTAPEPTRVRKANGTARPEATPPPTPHTPPTGNGSRTPAPRLPTLEPARLPTPGTATIPTGTATTPTGTTRTTTPTSAALAVYAAPFTGTTQAAPLTSRTSPTSRAEAAPLPHPLTKPAAHPHTPAPARTPLLTPRESLRLRIRWVQELQVRLVRDVARRLGIGVERVGLLRWAELAAVLAGEALPGDLHARVPQAESPPLPDAFRLADGQVVVAERTAGRGDGVRGVSAGRVVGTVWDGTGPRPTDAVLVVRTLDPALAPLLPDLTGLVAQTGSPLSHLAVLAREFGLPAVVGATDAVRRFPPGSRLTVDGTAGDVRQGDAP